MTVGCCDLPELGENELSSPHFSLASETVGADELEPIVPKNPVSNLNAFEHKREC